MALMVATVGKSIVVSTCIALLYTVHHISLNGIYFSLEYHGASPRLKKFPS